MNNNRLEDLREEHNLKSMNVAEILHVNKSTYSEWENNRIPIPTRRIIELADYYKINIDYMLKFSTKRKAIKHKTQIDLMKSGQRLRDIRQHMGLSLRELGDKLNCSFSALACYERGENLINTNILISLAYVSNYSIDYILCRSNTKFITK